MKVYVVVSNKSVRGVYTDKEKAEKIAKDINLINEMCGGYGLVAIMEEIEVE